MGSNPTTSVEQNEDGYLKKSFVQMFKLNDPSKIIWNNKRYQYSTVFFHTVHLETVNASIIIIIMALYISLRLFFIHIAMFLTSYEKQ